MYRLLLIFIVTFFTFVCSISFASSHNLNKTLPSAPSNLEVLETSFDFVLLIWSDNSDNETNFIIERHIEGASFSRYDTVEANSTLYIDYRVDPATTYYYRITAINSDGESGFSNVVSGITLSLPHTPPQKPLNLNGYYNTTGSVILSWTDNSDNEQSFYLFRGESLENFSLLDSVDAEITLFADYSVLAQHTYYYYLVASNDYGVSDPSDTISVVVTAINIPDSTRLRILLTTCNSVRLAWNNTNVINPSYTIHRLEEDTILVLADQLDDTAFSDTLLAPNTHYRYQVVTNDQVGTKYYSNIAEAYTLPWFIENRANDSLVALYFFANRINDTIPDLSWNRNPINLHVADTASIFNDNQNSMRIGVNNRLTSSYSTARKIIDACQNTDEITIECWLKTSRLIELPEAKIISLENEFSTAFSLGCSVDIFDPDQIKYHVNLTTRTTDVHGNPIFGIDVPIETDVLQHIVFIHKLNGDELLYLNGKITAEGFRPSKFDNWDDTYRLVVANSLTDDSPWLGSLYMCAIYNKALSDDEIGRNYLASPFMEPTYTLNPNQLHINILSNPPISDEVAIRILNENSTIDFTERYFVQLIDLNGIIVAEQDVPSDFETNSTEINISELKQGIYCIILCNQHEIIAREKLLIVR